MSMTHASISNFLGMRSSTDEAPKKRHFFGADISLGREFEEKPR
jgi:hypothetical protein